LKFIRNGQKGTKRIEENFIRLTRRAHAHSFKWYTKM